jgi:hypothetical protein
MSLQTSLQYMTRQAFRSLNGTLLPGTWVHRALPTYDPSTGNVVAPAPALYPVAVLVSMYKRDEIDGVRILATDRRLCVMQAVGTDPQPPGSAVPQGLPVMPTVRDQVEVQGTLWLLMDVAQDAAGLTWQCQARAEGEQG